MQRGHSSKKIRLEFTEVHDEIDDDGLWGEDLNFDDEVMQQIESQALSQYQEIQRPLQISMVEGNMDGRRRLPSDNGHNNEKLQEHLQMKQGEVKNLRIENDKLRKEFNNQLSVKDEVIEKLKKQLSEKQSEIEFQKMEKLSQTCKTPKSVRLPPNVNTNNTGSPFHERFQFTQSRGLIKDGKVFNFGGQLNKGDVLYKLLRSAFNLNPENHVTQVEKGNEFTLYLNCCLLQLCRFTSFEKSVAVDLIKLIISRSHDVLFNFLRLLTEKEIKQDLADKKIKVITLSKSENRLTRSTGRLSLVTNAQWFSKEKGIATRQTVTMLAKLMQIEPLLICMLIKTNDSTDTGNEVKRQDDEYKMKRTFATKENKLFDSLLNRDLKSGSLAGLTNVKSSETTMDILELFDEIVREISIRKKSYKYEGVFCSLLYFSSTLCNYSPHIIDEKHKHLMVNIVRKIVFSLPGLNVIQYVVDFLSSSTLYNLSDSLCHRSAADTFSENFKSFCFTQDTCILQVLCAQIEMTSKSAYFIHKFTSWIAKVTTGSHHIKWMHNKTNSKLCECLPAIEQITIRILLHCAEEMNNENLSIFEKILLKSAAKHCSNILKQFRLQDDQFIRNIANCLIEYEMLLNYLTGFADDERTKKFVSKEMAALRDRKNHHSLLAVNAELIKSVLEFSPLIEYD